LALSAKTVRENYERIQEEVGPSVTVVAATKYVSIDEMAALAEAGVEVVGENRAQDLAAKHDRYAGDFRWHFIGHLQSRKAKAVNDLCELVHSLDSESAARRLEVPALVQVNLAGEGVVAAVLPAPARAGGGVRPRRALDGDEPGLPHRSRRGRDVRPRGLRAVRPLT
jgi:uncharacterized pyridoxal phosphate-containing UPF0001 family protein